MTIRASYMSIADRCPPATFKPSCEISIAGGLAVVGTAGHWATELYLNNEINNGPCALTDCIFLAAEKFALTPEQHSDLERVTWAIHRKWIDFRQWFPNPILEDEIAYGELTGHPDLYSIVGSQVRILDWKTGFLDISARSQLLAYAWILLHKHPEIESVYAVQIQARTGTHEGWQWTREEVLEWWESFEARRARGTYYPADDLCWRCKRFSECPAAHAQARTALRLLEDDEHLLINPTPDEIIALDDRIRLIDKMVESAKDFRRSIVKASGGTLVASDGRGLRITETCKREILPAAYVLVDELTGGKADECVSIPNGKFEAAVKASVPKGKGTGAVRAAWDRLEEDGMVVRTTQERLEQFREAAVRITGEYTKEQYEAVIDQIKKGE